MANLGLRAALRMSNDVDFHGDPRRTWLGTQRAECPQREREERKQHDDAAEETYG
ncbi:hypothetical protein [Sorangium sp. So ce362]|uniref:hypothetical protein n=1 Tax=Sorangium sp. So ce362 TaxID=3133303 RepID=UPI003F5D8ABF